MKIDWIGRAETLTFCVKNFIDGQYRALGGVRRVDKYSPRDGRLLCQFTTGDQLDVEAAVASARRAYEDGRWSKLSTQHRKDVLYRLCALIEAHIEELALLESLDVGKPIRDALNFDLPTTITTIRFSAEAADKVYAPVYAADHWNLSYGLRRPVGVVVGIVGWNFPLCLAAQKIGPALAAGNCIVIKPSEQTCFSTARVAELAIEAGVPEGVLNVVHGDAGVGAALARHADVDLVSFTGSSRTGKELLIIAGESNMKRLILECGGKAPNIVFDDCPDIMSVADAIVASAFWNQGQVCVATSRLLVECGIKDELINIVADKTADLTVGDPLRLDTRFGALVSQNHKVRVLNYLEAGEREGARIVRQSRSPPPYEGGFYVPPTLVDTVTSSQKIAQEEIFGPVLSVMTFRDEEDAIKIANGTPYGLSATVWTRDLGRAHRISQQIDAGLVVVNAVGKPRGGPAEGVIPIGGHRESGIGVEGGLEGIEAYTKKTTVQYFV